MVKNIILSSCIFFVIASCPFFARVHASESNTLTFKKQPEIERIKPKKPVKIKLKRLSNGTYTWDLTGVDIEEIIRIDSELREQLKLE